MTKPLTILIGGTIALWAAVYFPARMLGGEKAVVYSLVALLICLIPATLTLAWSCQTMKRRPSQSFVVVASGTGVRVTMVLGAGLILNQAVAYFGQTSFWCWILGFYLVTLSLETLLVRSLKPVGSA